MGEFFNTNVDLGVRVVQTVTGEMILGHAWINEAKQVVTIERPVMPMMQHAPDGQSLRVSFLRRPLVKPNKVSVNMNHVVLMEEVAEDVLRTYQQYVSEIVIAPGVAIPSVLKP